MCWGLKGADVGRMSFGNILGCVDLVVHDDQYTPCRLLSHRWQLAKRSDSYIHRRYQVRFELRMAPVRTMGMGGIFMVSRK